ncbi:unnamed protein product [Symbiodinium sp. KB8]|nr:unnamed protein product [Symbiodinium sp. KB8]
MTVCLTSGEGGALDEAGRTVLVHTAALEAHAGHADTAQSLCKLLAGPSSASPALTAASHIMGADLLVALGDIATAREVVLAGTRVAPRHGPVWPALLRVEEAEVLRHQRRAWHASWESDLMAAAAGGGGGAGDAAATAAAVAASGLVPDMAGVRQVVPAALASDCTEVAWTLQFAVAVAEDAAATLCSERLSELARLGGAADDPSGRGRLRAALRAALTQCQSTCQDQARAALAGALRVAPPSSRWRVWSLGGRLEAVAGRQAAALAILRRSAGESAPKYRSHIYLDLSRVEEFAAMTAVRGGRRQDAASALLRAGAWARIALEAAPPTDWKCHIEAAYHHLRCGRRQEARDLLAWSLQFSPAAGRLHALRESAPKYRSHIYLDLSRVEEFAAMTAVRGGRRQEGDTAVVDALAAAVQQVPKGGEVWLQAARQCMNPLSLHYSTGRAAQCLLLALQFTPQYGDCFIEWARLDLLRWAGLATEGFTASTALQGVGRGLGLAVTAATCAGGDAAPPPLAAPTKTWVQFLSRENALRVRHWATWLSASPPNYGLLWAARRRHPSEPPSVILRRALKRLCVDIARTRHVYAAAAVASVLRTAARQQPGLLPRACLGPPPFVGKYSAGLLRAYTGGAAHPVRKQLGHGPLADVVDLHDVAGLAQATLDSAPSDRVWARESPVVLAPALLERGLVPGHSAHALQSGPRSGHLGSSSIMQGVAAKCAAVATSASGVVFFAQHAAAVAMGVLPHMPPDPCSVPICDGFKRQVLAQDGASVELECTDRLDFAFGDVAFSRQWLWGGRPLQPPPATNESPLLSTMRGRPLAALPPHRARQALWEVEGGSLT